jgi:hypothetical protein
MKLVLTAAVAVLLLATPAMAQTDPAAPAAANATSCGPLPPPPSLPDGATADREAMEAGNTAFTAWAEANRTVLACRRAEVESLQARFQALRAEYNAGAEQLNATNTVWQADVTEFNERGGNRRR